MSTNQTNGEDIVPTHDPKDCQHCPCQTGPFIGGIAHNRCCKCGERFAVKQDTCHPWSPPYLPPVPGWPYPREPWITYTVEMRTGDPPPPEPTTWCKDFREP